MAVDLTFTLKDAYSRQAKRGFEGIAATLADASTDATALMTDFNAISDAGVVKQTFSTETVINQSAQTGANRDVGGTLHCRLNNGKLYGLKIPMIKASMVNADGTIKLSDAAIVAFVANFEASGQYRVSEGNYIVAVEYGELDS